jgi:hypothetical protein
VFNIGVKACDIGVVNLVYYDVFVMCREYDEMPYCESDVCICHLFESDVIYFLHIFCPETTYFRRLNMRP